MIKPKKISDTSTRVLETLKVLVNSDSSIQDIINHFEKIDSNNRIYTNEVILKYINTLKVFGFKFVKNKDKYVLLNPPNHFFLNENDLRALCLIEKIVKVFPEEIVREEVSKFIQSIERRFSHETSLIAGRMTKSDCNVLNINYEKYAEIIRAYEKYCLDKQKIKITYTSDNIKSSIIVEPIEFSYREDKVYFTVYNPLAGSIQDIALENISEVNQLPVKANATSILATATFRIKGRLAQNYRLHEGEKVVQIEPDGSRIIVNQKEDKRFFLKRLMRYGGSCEVLSPKNLRQEMIEMIKDTIKLYVFNQ